MNNQSSVAKKSVNKVVRLGTVSVGNRNASVYCKVSFNNGKLSISGVEGPLPSGNALGSCGQIDMHLKASSFKTLASGWTFGKVQKFLAIWKEWHLNDMKAGVPPQEEAIKEWKALGNKYDYEKACEYLKSVNLYEVDGYKYGHAWNRVEVPNVVIEWLEALPETDKQPAWC